MILISTYFIIAYIIISSCLLYFYIKEYFPDTSEFGVGEALGLWPFTVPIGLFVGWKCFFGAFDSDDVDFSSAIVAGVMGGSIVAVVVGGLLLLILTNTIAFYIWISIFTILLISVSIKQIKKYCSNLKLKADYKNKLDQFKVE
ncbi:hypothetical protein ES708_13594 [subsurface metagenome]